MLASNTLGKLYVHFHSQSRNPIPFSVPKSATPPYQNRSVKPFAIADDGTDDAPSPPSEIRYRWLEIRRHDFNEQQKLALSQLPSKMPKRCKALMRQLIGFSPEKAILFDLLYAWNRKMKPRRTDWLSVLKELNNQNHPLYFEVAEIALLQDSFEVNVRDFTKLIHHYGKQSRLQEAEALLTSMKERAFPCDQVTLTALIHMYSKAGHLEKAEATFHELKFLDQSLDERAYGAMVMAYIRGGMPAKGEAIISEMDRHGKRAGREVYKALLRSYAMAGDSQGAQRVFDAIQIAGIPPDEKICGLLINAYQEAGDGEQARIAFQNMRLAGLKPDDRCVSLMISGYERDNELLEALDFLAVLEKDGCSIGKEASEILAKWFRRLGVLREVEIVL